jgi:hypothetical protein
MNRDLVKALKRLPVGPFKVRPSDCSAPAHGEFTFRSQARKEATKLSIENGKPYVVLDVFGVRIDGEGS